MARMDIFEAKVYIICRKITKVLKNNIFMTILAVLLLFIAGNFLYQTGWSIFIDTEIASRYGTFVGGILSFISVVLIYYTLKNQQKYQEKQQQIDLQNEFNRRFDFAFEYNKWIKKGDAIGYEVMYSCLNIFFYKKTEEKNRMKEQDFKECLKPYKFQFDKFMRLILDLYKFNKKYFCSNNEIYNKMIIDSNMDIAFKKLVLYYSYYLNDNNAKELLKNFEYSDEELKIINDFDNNLKNEIEKFNNKT